MNVNVAGATAEVATLKEAVSKAENSAALERTEREKQEARVAAVWQELQDAVKKYESLERDSKTQESELAKALQSAQDARAEAQSALREIQVAQDIAAGKAFITQKQVCEGSVPFTYPNLDFFQERLRICRATYQILQSSIEPKKGALRRSCSGLSTLPQSI